MRLATFIGPRPTNGEPNGWLASGKLSVRVEKRAKPTTATAGCISGVQIRMRSQEKSSNRDIFTLALLAIILRILSFSLRAFAHRCVIFSPPPPPPNLSVTLDRKRNILAPNNIFVDRRIPEERVSPLPCAQYSHGAIVLIRNFTALTIMGMYYLSLITHSANNSRSIIN